MLYQTKYIKTWMYVFTNFITNIHSIIVPFSLSPREPLIKLQYNSKMRMLIYLSFMLSIGATLALVARIIIDGSDTASIISMATISVTGFSLYFMLRFSKKLELGILLVNVICFIGIPLRVYQTGGVIGPAIYAYFFHILLMAILKGRKAGLLVFLWTIISIMAFGISDIPASFSPPPIYHAVFACIIIFINLAVLNLVFVQNEIISKKVVHYEKKESAQVIMDRLSHEVGNSLHISLNLIRLSSKKSHEDDPNLKAAIKRITEIDHIIKSMAHVKDKAGLVDLLKEFRAETNIAKKIENIQQIDKT